MEQRTRRLFDVDEYYRMGEIGILPEDASVELVGGEVIEVARLTPRHASVNMVLYRVLLNAIDAGTAIVSVRHPVRLDHLNEPIPDVVVIRFREDYYRAAHPTPADCFVAIEVADSAVRYVREVKLPVYARAGIREVWIVDLDSDAIEVYGEAAEGVYSTQRTAKRGDTLSPTALDGVSITVDEVLG